MVIHESAENYLETILIIKNEQGKVRSIDIARAMNYSKPSISRAMRLLRENDCITMDGVDPEIAAQDACKMEHDLSKETFEKLKQHIAAEHPEL